MSKIIRLTESDLVRLTKKIIKEGFRMDLNPTDLIARLNALPNKTAQVVVEGDDLVFNIGNQKIGLDCSAPSQGSPSTGVNEQAATAASIAAQKPVMTSDRVKQLVGFLKNGNYTSSEIQQAQNMIKNPSATRAPQQSPVVVSQKSQQTGGAQAQPVQKTGGAQPVQKAGSSTQGYGYGK